ncbi:hypothetical protein NM688_g5346 [Phlebia brevispora]|uniref:Uncharacterized protein n=1 Tax=Phlebia brevispora TaxID=194682 RepID=A0ACC1SX50_9APHY|nr:hypothetical protein NM688_g5346 [Phlebia brevispora]
MSAKTFHTSIAFSADSLPKQCCSTIATRIGFCLSVSWHTDVQQLCVLDNEVEQSQAPHVIEAQTPRGSVGANDDIWHPWVFLTDVKRVYNNELAVSGISAPPQPTHQYLTFSCQRLKDMVIVLFYFAVDTLAQVRSHLQAQPTFHTFLDYQGVPLSGILVPQQVYPAPVAFQPNPAIRFFNRDGTLGIPLVEAFGQQFGSLIQGDSIPNVTNTSVRVAMRILWPGYEPWSDNVHVYDHSAATHPFTLAKLAHATAKAVKKFLDNMGSVPSREPRADWNVSAVPFASLRLVELRHVSTGSWQPVLTRVVN